VTLARVRASFDRSLRRRILLQTYLTLAGLVLALALFAHHLVERSVLDGEIGLALHETELLASDDHVVEAFASGSRIEILRHANDRHVPDETQASAFYLATPDAAFLALAHVRSSFGPDERRFPTTLDVRELKDGGEASLMHADASTIVATVPVRVPHRVDASEPFVYTSIHPEGTLLGAIRTLRPRGRPGERSTDYRWMLTLGSVVLLLLGTFAVNRVVDGLLEPIVALEAGLQRVTDGHLEHRIAFEREDEIGRLASMFNEMAERLAESRLAEAANARTLEIRVAERTHQLQVAMDELRSLDRARESFLSSVSHELRTPLTSILAGIEILRDFAPTEAEEREEFLGIVHAEAERMLHLVGDIVDYAKVAADAMRLDLAEHDVGALLEQVLAQESGRTAQAGLVVLARYARRGFRCLCDEQRIRQVLRNLLDNAIKFSPRGGTIRVELGLDAAEWWLRVADEGPGVPAPVRERIFGRFGNGESPVDAGGIGVGLPLCKHIAEAHGGTITLEPTAQGASFLVRIPSTAKPPVDDASHTEVHALVEET
jgi:signal transduction histidine kinase